MSLERDKEEFERMLDGFEHVVEEWSRLTAVFEIVDKETFGKSGHDCYELLDDICGAAYNDTEQVKRGLIAKVDDMIKKAREK